MLTITCILILLEELINEAMYIAEDGWRTIIHYARDNNKLLLYANKLSYKGFPDCLFKLRTVFYLPTCYSLIFPIF